MREQLQALVDRWHERGIPSILWVLQELKRILATEPPAVSVKAGWVCKDKFGLWHYAVEPKWSGYWYGIRQLGLSYDKVGKVLTDPWAKSHPNGGPECIMEVK